MGLEIRLTGSVTLHSDCGRPRHLSSSQAQVAMVRLTMERRAGTTRDQLADTLWPDGLPNTWASALRSVVSRVRAFVADALPPGSVALVAEAGRYLLCLPDDAVVDLEHAEAAILDAADALAAGDFDDARRLASSAASCLRAPLLPDHDGEWVTGARQRLGDLLVTGLETASLAAAAMGDHGVALGFANEAIRREPLRESAHRCRMTAHVTAGNRAEALRTYQQLRRSLAEELGVDPAAETEAAYLDLLGRPSAPMAGAGMGPGEFEATARTPPVGGVLLGPAAVAPFVGREAELAVLTGAWARAQAGSSHMVLVTGEPGIGKTRLITEAAHRVTAAGGLVLCGRSDRDADAPCQPFVEALGGYLAATPADALPDLTPATRTELARVIPAVDMSPPPPHETPRSSSSPPSSGLPADDPDTTTGRSDRSSARGEHGSRGDAGGRGPSGRRRRPPGRGRPPGTCGPPWARRRHGHAQATAPAPPAPAAGTPTGPEVGTADPGPPALIDALVEVMDKATRDRPVLVVLDDLHVADRDTLVLLRRVARQCVGAPLLIVATGADRESRNGTFAAAVHDLGRDGWLQRLPLPGLGQGDARALSRHVPGGASTAGRPPTHRLVADTAGNPFLLLQLLRARRGDEDARTVPEPVPPAVHEYAAAQASALDDAGRELLWAAVVAGPSFELDLADDASGLAPSAALDALDALLAAGLVTEAGDASHVTPSHRYRFRQEIVRRALFDQLSGARRRRLHTRLADAIERRRGPDLGHYTPAVAHHRAAGAPPSGDRQAARWGLAAAARARAGRAPNEAVRLYVQALDHLPPDDNALRAEALTDLGLAQHDAGDPDCDRTLLDGAIHARRHGHLDIAARAALGLADVVATRPRLRSEAVALIEDVLASASPRWGPATGPVDELALARLVAQDVQLSGRTAVDPATADAVVRALTRELPRWAGPAHVRRRLGLSDDLLAVAAATGDRRACIVGAHHRAMAAEMTGELGVRDEALATLASAGRDTDVLGAGLRADHAVAVAFTQGRFADAAAAARRVDLLAGDDADGIAPAPGNMAARQMLVGTWLLGGVPREDPSAPPPPEHPALPQHPADQALVLLAAGDRGRAHLAVRDLATGAEPVAADDEWLHTLGVVALAAVELGDPTTAEAVRALLLPYADLPCGAGYRSFVGTAAFHLGRLALVTGDWPEAERHLTSALRQLAACDARPWEGTARGASPWAALAQLALAAALEARGRAGDRRWVTALRAEAGWAVRRLGLDLRDSAPLPTA